MYGETSAEDDGDDAHPDGEEEADADKGDSKSPTPVLVTFSVRHLKPIVWFPSIRRAEIVCSNVHFHHCSELHNRCNSMFDRYSSKAERDTAHLTQQSDDLINK